MPYLNFKPTVFYGLFAGLCIFYILAPATYAQNPAILDSSVTSIQLSPYLTALETQGDIQDPKEFTEHKNLKWKPILAGSVNLGFTQATYWFYGEIETKTLDQKEWLLEQSYPLIDYLDVYLFKDTHLIEKWHTGDKLKFSDRPFPHANFIFPLKLESNQRYQIYIRAQNTEAMELPLRLQPYDQFAAADNQRSVIDGIFYGFLIIMAAYNLVLYFNIRDQSYLFYVAYVLGMLLFFMSQKGILFQTFYPNSPEIHHYSIPIILLVNLFSIAYFFKHFLQLPKQVPRIWLTLKINLMLSALLTIGLFLLSYQTAIFLIIGNAAIAATLGLFVAIYLSTQQHKTAQMVLAGWTLLIICILFMTLSKMGIIYNEFMANFGMRLGTSIEIVIFSFALSYRINEERALKEAALKQVNQERSERIQAQEIALQHEVEARQAKENALAQQQQLNEKLESLVHERTATLEKTLMELESANRELELLSAKDGLTGVYNRRSFDQKSQDEWARSYREQQPLSLLLLDIDHFKKINDTKGHPCGDYVLKEITKVMLTVLSRPTDAICRYGGEEFAVLMPNTPKSGAKHVAASLVSAIATHTFIWENSPFTVTVSIGAHTMTAANSQSLQKLIAAADGALYNAKHNGRNQWVCVE